MKQEFLERAACARLTPELIAQLGLGAALLLRVAAEHPSPDARAAERWLSTILDAAGMFGGALKAEL